MRTPLDEIDLCLGEFETTELPGVFLAVGGEEHLMPSKTPKQARTMRAAAHDRGFAKKLGIPQKVAKEYVAADKKAGKGKKK